MRSVILTALAILGACSAPSVQPLPTRPHTLVGYAAGQGGEKWLTLTQDTIAKLDVDCPLDAPVLVVIKNVPGRWAQSYWSPLQQRYVIELSPGGDQSDSFYVDSIIHEWAHCMTRCLCLKAHCKHWGENYATCYRAVCDDS